MERLITTEYFRNEPLALPYISLSAGYQTPSARSIDKEQTNLERQIDIYQKEFLTLLFGSEVAPTEAESLLVDADLLRSPIANYVYCHVLPQYQARATNAGVKQKNAEISETVDPLPKMCRAWNEMVRMNAAIRKALDDAGKDDTYPTDYNDPIYHLMTEIW
jgi:hypothetical protein